MSGYSRRDFIKTGVAAGAAAAAGNLPLHAARRTATDMVTLGNSGLKVTRLAFGTGSNNGHVQAALGQAEFTKLVRYAYDRGIRFFETAEAYMTPGMLGEALKGLPRDSYQLMSKVKTYRAGQRSSAAVRRNAQDHRRRTISTSCCCTGSTPPTGWRRRSAGRTASSRRRRRRSSIRAALRCTGCRLCARCRRPVAAGGHDPHESQRHGHGRAVPDVNEPGNVPEVVQHVKQVKQEGMGVISMKLVGDGRFTRHEDRVAAMNFAFRNAGIDCATVGFKSTAGNRRSHRQYERRAGVVLGDQPGRQISCNARLEFAPA